MDGLVGWVDMVQEKNGRRLNYLGVPFLAGVFVLRPFLFRPIGFSVAGLGHV